MPIDYEGAVLLGDSDPERSAFLADVIENDFAYKVVTVDFCQYVEGKLFEARDASTKWMLVLLAEDLKISQAERVRISPEDIRSLFKIPGVRTLACIYSTEADPPNLTTTSRYIPLVYVPPSTDSDRRHKVINGLRECGLKEKPGPPIELDDDPILVEQIRSLSATGEPDEAKKIFGNLIRNLQKSSGDSVIVSRLIQGASGSKVFRFRPKDVKSKVNERVLKIAHYTHGWKLSSEVEKHLTVQATLGNEYAGYVPRIEPCEGSHNQYVTQSQNWHAIAYDFLGGAKFGKGGNRFGKFMDLETALIGSHQELQEKTANTRFEEYFATTAVCADGRRRFLELLLNWLSNNWYLAHSTRGAAKPLWDYSKGPDKSFEGFPPYRIPARSKSYILNFLDSRTAQMGSRFLDGWDEYYKTVRNFIASEELSNSYNLAAPQRAILSPAHGDLNSNNILLWLDEVEHPFLIDFPFYQESGHALQDFARLEVEVKFTLMDRQADSSPAELPAFDYTQSQVRLWQALEDHLLRETWDTNSLKFPSGSFDNNVKLSHELVKLIRTKALAVQNQHQPTPPVAFCTEYKPALLYHTLRAIGYDSLSPFKRILAVCSAAHLLDQSRSK